MEDLYAGSNIFPLPNGDIYVGDFCAHRNGQLWREGHGFYQTHDGHIYEGIWKNDKLVDNGNVAISFPTGDYFDGRLFQDKFDDSGSFTFKDGMRLLAEFRNNKPDGHFQVVDTSGDLWHGRSNDQDVILARREHSFFANIPEWRGLKKSSLIEMQPDFAGLCTISPISSATSLESRHETRHSLELEKLVFEKYDPITVIVEDWFASPWYDDYIRYVETREYILRKVAARRSLSPKEAIWYHKYLQTKRVAAQIVAEIDTSQLDQFYSRSYRDSPKPYMQVYATCIAPPTSLQDSEPCEEDATTQRSDSSLFMTVSQSSTEERLFEQSGQEQEKEEEKTPVLMKRNHFLCQSDSLFDYVEITTGRRVPKRCRSVKSN